MLFTRDTHPWVDVTALAELAKRKDRTPASYLADIEQANGLYRGYFLEGVTKYDSAAFEEWSLLKREQYHRQALILFQKLADDMTRSAIMKKPRSMPGGSLNWNRGAKRRTAS